MYPALTLDGFIADLDGDSDSWADDGVESEYEAEVKRCGCVIIGGKTYLQYKSDFDSGEDATTFVCTNNPDYQDTEKLKFIHGTPQEMLNIVEQHGFSEAILSGGGEINGLFASAGLVDEIIVSVYPLTLGQGIPLFGSYHPRLKLQLISSQQGNVGITQNHYKVVK